MLPNHSSLAIAEQFGTLESLYPGRIDLGLGRAPGSDPQTRRALRKGANPFAQDFPAQLQELIAYLDSSGEGYEGVHAIPGEGLRIPIWLLGSSTLVHSWPDSSGCRLLSQATSHQTISCRL